MPMKKKGDSDRDNRGRFKPGNKVSTSLKTRTPVEAIQSYILKNSRHGKKYIQVLDDMAMDKKVSPGIRHKCIETLMKLSGLDQKQSFDAQDVADIATAISELDGRIKARMAERIDDEKEPLKLVK